MMSFKKFKTIITSIVFTFPIFVTPAFAQKPPSALDQFKKGVADSGAAASFTEKPLAELIGNILGALLSLVGLIFLIFVLYGGFMWMTSQGEKDKIDKAQKIIKNSSIGVVLIMLSYAIVTFIVNTVKK
jgi:cytochrome bd-type quinol oxidase subunit 2